MQSKATDVAYLAGSPARPGRPSGLRPSAEMPARLRRGDGLQDADLHEGGKIGRVRQPEELHLAYPGMKAGIVEAHRDELAAASIGKSCIRFARPEKLDFAVIEKLLVATCDSAEAAC